MAPEELWGEQVDRRADLFALGVVLYRMTAGRYPFGTEGSRDSVRRLLAGAEATPPRSFVPDYPEALEALILSVLSEKPHERPATALEFRQALFKAVPPASEDDVAQFLAELFSGRRLERDERLRLALDQRGPSSAKPSRAEGRPEAERSNLRKVSRPSVSRSRKVAVGFGIVGVAMVLLGLFSLLQRGGKTSALPELNANAVAATVEPAPVPTAVPALTADPAPALAAREPAPTAEGATRARSRHEKPPIDLSPVREVGF
jgi:serine/threonine-protein kinase